MTKTRINDLIIDISKIPDSGNGVFLKQGVNVINKNDIIGEYYGYEKSEALITMQESIYAFELNDGITIIGTGILSKINDIISFRELSKKETYDLDRNKKLPTIGGLKYNCTWLVSKNKAYVKAIRDIKSGDELYIDYGIGYWTILFTDHGFLANY